MPDESVRGAFDSMRRACLALVAFAGLGVAALPLTAQVRLVTRNDVLRAEDARGLGAEGVAPLLAGLRNGELRELSIRAIGRLERPDLIPQLLPLFGDAAVRGAVSEALAQSLRGLPASARRSAAEKRMVDTVFQVLSGRVGSGSSASVLGGIAQSVGRLPFDEPAQARQAERFLVSLVPISRLAPGALAAADVPLVEGVVHGLYSLARARRTLGDFTPPTIEWLRLVAAFARGEEWGARIRRPAWYALTAAGGADPESIAGAIADDDDAQVRRLAIAALPNVGDSAFRRQQLDRTQRDRDPMVRLEWVRVYRQVVVASDCRPLISALDDSVSQVRLAAIDALAGPCPPQDDATAVLRQVIAGSRRGNVYRDHLTWHGKAHALVALARIDPDHASDLLRRESRNQVWQVRMYVARGAAAMRDTALLTSLAFDNVGNVREAAIMGLSATLGHLADLVYVRALGSTDYHVVLAAARALKGAPVRDSVLPGVMLALERISREQRQTSRDPRMELLTRVRELGDRATVPGLQGLLSDVDDVVAEEAASVMNHLSDTDQYARAASRRAASALPASGQVLVQVTMSSASGGQIFDIALDGDRAPWSTARVSALIKAKYFDGLTFHRVVPNFVLQGGSPGMNEYVGDGPFMRDELSLAHHDRYTLGISTRGRDTGDAQWFINLVDNYRLDHEYTVIGRIVRGFDVVDRILEGDTMQTVRVLPPGRSTGNRTSR